MKSTYAFLPHADRRVARRSGPDRRKTVRLFNYWQRLRGSDRRLVWTPGFLAGIPDLKPYCLVRSVIGQRPASGFEYMGAHFSQQLSCFGGERSTSAFPAAVIMGELSELGRDIAQHTAGIFVADEFKNLKNDNIRARRLVLPFSAATPDHHVWLGLGSWTVTPADTEAGAAA